MPDCRRQGLPDRKREVFGEQHAEGGIELSTSPMGIDPETVLPVRAAIAETGCSGVTGSGDDFRKASCRGARSSGISQDWRIILLLAFDPAPCLCPLLFCCQSEFSRLPTPFLSASARRLWRVSGRRISLSQSGRLSKSPAGWRRAVPDGAVQFSPATGQQGSRVWLSAPRRRIRCRVERFSNTLAFSGVGDSIALPA